jgi:exoribonuclease-2
VNQWQIIACARYGKTAALAAPFKPKDADLFAIISSFDAAYSSYKDFQNAIERFWILKYVQQQGIVEVEATLFKDNLVRADHLPLVMLVAGAQNLPRWSRVMVRLGDIDLVSLNVYGTVTARLDTTEDASASDDEQEDDTLAGPIAICVDVSDTEPASPPTGDFLAS